MLRMFLIPIAVLIELWLVLLRFVLISVALNAIVVPTHLKKENFIGNYLVFEWMKGSFGQFDLFVNCQYLQRCHFVLESSDLTRAKHSLLEPIELSNTFQWDFPKFYKICKIFQRFLTFFKISQDFLKFLRTFPKISKISPNLSKFPCVCWNFSKALPI